MGLWANDRVFDEGLNIVSSGKKLCLCTTQPTDKATSTGDYMRGISTHLDFDAIANSTMTAGGRKLPVQATSNIAISSSGPIHHIAIITGTTLLYVTMCTTRLATTSDTVTVPAWRIEINDPTTDTG